MSDTPSGSTCTRRRHERVLAADVGRCVRECVRACVRKPPERMASGSDCRALLQKLECVLGVPQPQSTLDTLNYPNGVL